jgi:hypothetical protein
MLDVCEAIADRDGFDADIRVGQKEGDGHDVIASNVRVHDYRQLHGEIRHVHRSRDNESGEVNCSFVII